MSPNTEQHVKSAHQEYTYDATRKQKCKGGSKRLPSNSSGCTNRAQDVQKNFRFFAFKLYFSLERL
jgi:hypothetical protein